MIFCDFCSAQTCVFENDMHMHMMYDDDSNESIEKVDKTFSSSSNSFVIQGIKAKKDSFLRSEN